MYYLFEGATTPEDAKPGTLKASLAATPGMCFVGWYFCFNFFDVQEIIERFFCFQLLVK